MANREVGYGFTSDLNEKQAAKFDPIMTNEVFKWMNSVFEYGNSAERVPEFDDDASAEDQMTDELVHSELYDGKKLCYLINCIKPEAVLKINKTNMAFKLMENIEQFLNAVTIYLSANIIDMFQVVDLYEGINIPQVVNGIAAVGRRCHSFNEYTGPSFGSPEAVQQKRNWTAAQLKAGDGIIGLQMGTNQYASQKGMAFGKNRMILNSRDHPDAPRKDGQGLISLQMGTNRYASQKGMAFGDSRQCIPKSGPPEPPRKEGQSIVSLQMGTNKCASQKGMSFGDNRMCIPKSGPPESALKAGEGTIGLQMGTNTGASQAGMNMGKTRSVLD